MVEISTILSWIILGSIAWVVGWCMGLLYQRLIQPHLPRPVKSALLYAREWYFGLFRRATPDWVYKLWLRTGIMDSESYRAFQDRGYINDQLEPEYIKP